MAPVLEQKPMSAQRPSKPLPLGSDALVLVTFPATSLNQPSHESSQHLQNSSNHTEAFLELISQEWVFSPGQKLRMLWSSRCFSWLISLPLSTLEYHSIRKRPPQNTLPKRVSLFCLLLTPHLASGKHIGKYEYRHGYRFFVIQFVFLSRMQCLWR